MNQRPWLPPASHSGKLRGSDFPYAKVSGIVPTVKSAEDRWASLAAGSKNLNKMRPKGGISGREWGIPFVFQGRAGPRRWQLPRGTRTSEAGLFT